MALNSWTQTTQTYQILKNDDEVCIPSVSNILLAVWISVKKRVLQIGQKLFEKR